MSTDVYALDRHMCFQGNGDSIPPALIRKFLHNRVLARRLGLEPKDARGIEISVSHTGQGVWILIVIDGKRLTPEQERLVQAYVAEVSEGTLTFMPSGMSP